MGRMRVPVVLKMKKSLDKKAEKEANKKQPTETSASTLPKRKKVISEEPKTDSNDNGSNARITSPKVNDGPIDVNKKNSSKPANDSNDPSSSKHNDLKPQKEVIDKIETPTYDVNAYQHKKTFAQGMLDLALLTANANQLRYVMESYRNHPYSVTSLILISLSIILQVIVGVGLISITKYNINDEQERRKANRINNLTVVGIFIVTVLNVFISAFGVVNPILRTS